MKKPFMLGLLFFVCCAAFPSLLLAQSVPSPKDVIGFVPGEDRKLASWKQIVSYFQKLEDTSPRVKFETLGNTTLGRPFVFAAISSPENLKKLAYYQNINAKLADPRLIGRNDAVAKKLIAEGKTVVLVTLGIHSTEVGGPLASMLIAHRLASSDDQKIKRMLDETIILVVPSLNPDGVDIVKDWYDRTLGTPYEGTIPPELYHHFTGHDNNRDWYIFSQVETQMTVDKLHNAWHPQIVHDIHQQGAFGARLFLPPYMDPVEPNVPKQIVEGYRELGSFIADTLRKDGFKGLTNNTTYDAWTPARAYSHYHGGVRILSESASVELATPKTITFGELRGEVGGLDAKKESKNFGPLWNGGEWHLSDITKQMTEGAFKLLEHAAENREAWLSRFYEIGKEATRKRGNGEVFGFILPAEKTQVGQKPSQKMFNRQRLLEILKRGGVESSWISGLQGNGKRYPEGSIFIPMAQPYGAFAKAILEKQVYPDLLDEKGDPVQPYDVTAHTLSILFGLEVETLTEPISIRAGKAESKKNGCPAGALLSKQQRRNGAGSADVWLYKSFNPTMDEGWTRYMFENLSKDFGICDFDYASVTDRELRNPSSYDGIRTIVFPDQSATAILNGHQKGRMPEEFTGGVGQTGVEALKSFVEKGGRIVFLNRASDFAIHEWNLPIQDLTEGLPKKQFFIPGSILRTVVDTGHPIARGMEAASIAWFEDSPAFKVTESENIKIIARYPTDPKQILLSGWAFGLERIAGNAALVEVKIGKGSLILFGFRPQYRAQSYATMPLLYNAIR